MTQHFSMGQFGKLTGLTPKALRRYEEVDHLLIAVSIGDA
jgi:DNA-binding transcriptional MerR regulator